MKKEIKAKWLKALRSGRYKQCEGYLHTGKGYCCLGILAKVQGAKFIQIGDGDGDIPFFPKYKGKVFDGSSSYLDKELAAGLRTNSQMKLSKLNDGLRKYDDDSGTVEFVEPPLSFKEIADYIEKHY
jgi:hypothetical protein